MHEDDDRQYCLRLMHEDKMNVTAVTEDPLTARRRSVLCFYSKSADKYPGTGAGETLHPDDLEKLEALNRISNWRRMLSNFHSHPFELDGMWWDSVEHYYQGSKFTQHPEFRALFSLDSKSDICEDPILAKAAGGKTGKSKGRRLRPLNISCDEDFFSSGRSVSEMDFFSSGRSASEMRRAQEAKFSKPSMKRMLLLTGDCVLNHFVGRSAGTVTVYSLMEIRDALA